LVLSYMAFLLIGQIHIALKPLWMFCLNNTFSITLFTHDSLIVALSS
jgi:hypothetical protein